MPAHRIGSQPAPSPAPTHPTSCPGSLHLERSWLAAQLQALGTDSLAPPL